MADQFMIFGEIDTLIKICRPERSNLNLLGARYMIEPIEAGDFVVEYVGELVRPRVSICQTFLLAYLR